MRILHFLFIIFCFLTSCRNNVSDNTGDTYITKKIRRQVLKVAADHVKAQLQFTEKKVLENGAIVYSGSEIEYLVDIPCIVMGEINGDSSPDAIVSIFIFRDKILNLMEHLVLINNKKGKLIMNKVLNGNMKFLSIQDGIISIETSKVDPDSPFYGCEECKEIHKYHFTGGELQKIE